jgi:Lon protease-like protein
MFPLGTVLLPGAVLPLHVFEPRYRALVQHCMAGDREFGVVLIERGSEVGGGDVRTTVGTVARIAEVQEMPDGRYVLIAVGTRRFRVVRWLPDGPFPLAEVEDWPDDSPAPGFGARFVPVAATLRRLLALSAELGLDSPPATTELADDPVLATYHVAALAPIGPADRYRVLRVPGPDERVTLLADLLDDAETLARLQLADESRDDLDLP